MKTVIQNGMICDGTGHEPELKDILIENNRIAELASPGTFAGAEADIIDASGKIIAPGFIDVHAHGDKRKLRFKLRRVY